VIARGVDLDRARGAIRDYVAALGHDVEAEGLAPTADRVAAFGAGAYPGETTVPAIPAEALLPAEDDGPIVLRDVPFRSVCEHHLLPFAGRVSIVYRPGAHIVGLGRLTGLVAELSRRLQLQERFTAQLADAVADGLHPAGVLVVTTATHSCLWARGDGDTTTALTVTAARGLDQIGRVEALVLVGAVDAVRA
jgi:GTP cyclohydrolase I